MCSQLTFDKRARNTQWGKDTFFNKRCWKRRAQLRGRARAQRGQVPGFSPQSLHLKKKSDHLSPNKINGLGKLDNHTKRIKLDPRLTPLTKVNPKLAEDLNRRAETERALGETMRLKLLDTSQPHMSRCDTKSPRRESKNKQGRPHLTQSLQLEKPSPKCEGNLRHGRKYLQVIYLVRALSAGSMWLPAAVLVFCPLESADTPGVTARGRDAGWSPARL